MTDWTPRTKLVHTGIKRSQYGELSEAIFLTQGFAYDTAEQAEARFIEAGPDEYIYARYGNPTVRMFEERIAALEGAEDGFATASGMAAVSGALTALLKSGDHVVAARALFGSCLYILEEILARYGVEVTLVDGTDLAQWRAAIRDDTAVVFFESVSNPTLEIVDIRVKQLDWQREVRESVFARMRAERGRDASEHRARGREEAEKIRAEADRTRTVLLAEAYRDAQRIRGEGDAQAAAIYAKAYNGAAQFFRFYRSLQAYRLRLSESSDLLVLEPDSDFFRYLKKSGGK